MALHAVPTELLAHIALFLACDDPFSPPRDLLALQATNKTFRLSLNCHLNPGVWATCFKFRFDSRAVLRRNFSPTGRDYHDQLKLYTSTLTTVRRKDFTEDEDTMRTVYIMLLDNNGKNRSQLDHAGIDVYLGVHLRRQLWADADDNEGWPTDRLANVYSLWSSWMTTTTARLREEHDRELVVNSILPFVLNPYRYHQAEAPPSHFTFPLPSHLTYSSSLLYPHGPYPIYPSRLDFVPYFGSMPPFSPPPIATAAKLLYFARREIIPFNIPPGIPATRAQAPATPNPVPTQEDFVEINSHRGAQPPRHITWDWDHGHALVDGIPDDSVFDHSINWDPDYWRRRLCTKAWAPDPKWRPGNVYVPGSMDGLWQGRLIFPPEEALRDILTHAQFPDDNSFTETDIHLTHQPMFMRLKEHHAVSTSSAPAHIPFPAPTAQQTNDDTSSWTDLSMRNAWLPGPPGSVSFTNPHHHPYSNNPNEDSPVFIGLFDQAPEENQSQAQSAPPHEQVTWRYQTFNRRLDAQKRKKAEMEQTGYTHSGSEQCETCREREEVIKRARELDEVDHNAIAAVYAEEWYNLDSIEAMFSSVGLGRDETPPPMDDGMDESNDYSSTDGIDDDDVDEDRDGDDDDETDSEDMIEFIPDENADVVSENRPVRRGTDRAKIRPCDGIQDIIFSGATDRRHSLAWNEFTFYGRVRPWDGLIGILRRSLWPRQNLLFFYGYLVGSETFVGNWRFAALDPNAPTWESAFVMSKRKEDDLASRAAASGS